MHQTNKILFFSRRQEISPKGLWLSSSAAINDAFNLSSASRPIPTSPLIGQSGRHRLQRDFCNQEDQHGTRGEKSVKRTQRSISHGMTLTIFPDHLLGVINWA